MVHASFLGALARVRLATDDGEVLAQLPAVDAAGLDPRHARDLAADADARAGRSAAS